MIDRNGYFRVLMPGHPRANLFGWVCEHVLIAEKALGRPLDPKHIVHHVNGVRHDNRPENLVICENTGYHHTLHRRQRAVDAGYPPDWRQCQHCRQYEAPVKTSVVRITKKGQLYHLECLNLHTKEIHKKKRSGSIAHRYRDAPPPFPPHWRRCRICKQYDDPQTNPDLNVTQYGMVHHRQCAKLRSRLRVQKSRAASDTPLVETEAYRKEIHPCQQLTR